MLEQRKVQKTNTALKALMRDGWCVCVTGYDGADKKFWTVEED